MPEDTDQPQPDNAPDNVAGESAPDNDAPPEQAQPTFPQVQVQLAADGLHVFVAPAPVTLGINAEVMDALCRDWLAKRPELFTALVQERIEQVRQAQQHLQLVTDPKTVKRINKSKQGLPA